MKRILASMIDFGGVSPENLVHNYRRFLAADINWTQPPDARIFAYIEKHFDGHGELPNGTIIRDHFAGANDQETGDIEVIERLKDIKAATPYIRTNFGQLLANMAEEQRKTRFVASLKEAHDLARRDVDKGVALLKEKLDSFEKKSAALRLKTVGVSTIRAPLPALVWTCEGLRFAPGGVTLFAGYGDSAKSMFVQYIVLCVVSGTPAFGTFPISRGNVLHLDYEQGERASYERYQRLANGHGIPLEALPEDALRLAVFPETYLDDEETEGILRSTVEEHKTDLLVFDSFKAGTPDTEENASAARKPLDMLNRICGPSRAAFGIHHSRKPPTERSSGFSDPRMSIRGAGAIYDAVQGAFVFDRDRADQTSPIQIHHVKERLRGRRLDTFGFRVVDVANPSDPTDTHWGLRLEFVPPEQMQAAASSPNPNPRFVALCQSAFARILLAGAAGITRNALKDTGNFGGSATIGKIVSHLVETGHVAAREVTTGPSQARGTFYSAAEGATSYVPPTDAPVGLGLEDCSIVNDVLSELMI